MGNASLELDKTMGPRPANSIRDRSLIDGFTKVRMYGCNLILRQPSLRNALQGGSDHVRMLTWVNEQHRSKQSWAQRYWDRFMGVTGPNDSAVEAISPISHVGSITMPVLLIHGKDDTVVPFEQSQLMYDALKRARKDVQLVTLKHEDHWLSRGETRLQLLQASVAFLRAHNPPD